MSYGIPEITDTHIKCEACGKWFKKICHLHVIKFHKINLDEYKERYGFSKSQPLEAFYIKALRQKYVKKYKTHRDNFEKTGKYRIKKGQVFRKDKRRWQELYRLKKYNDRIKGKVLVLSPAEVVAIFDLRKIGYPYARIAYVMYLSVNYIKNLLATKKALYKRWKKYYCRTVK